MRPIDSEDRAQARSYSDESADVEEKSIAVLPFVNLSSDPEQEFFSDGVAEEILNVLTHVPNLKVAARTSSFKFKGKEADAAEIGQQLQVNHLLEGSVRKSGNTLRITAQLIETNTGFHLWSKTFDRQLEDVFAIQDEIAASIADELRATLGTEQGATSVPVDLAAYELYLKGRGLVALRQEAGLLEAIDLLKSAHEVDPAYAPVMAALATAYLVLPWFSDTMPSGDARELARDWAAQALRQEPENTDALAVMAYVVFLLDVDLAASRSLFEKAIKNSPGNVNANNFYGDFLLRTGDFEKALVYESKAAELDPLSPVHLSDLANVYVQRAEYDQAALMIQRALELNPRFFNAWQSLSDVYYFQGDLPALERMSADLEAIGGLDSFQLPGVRFTIMMAKGDTAAMKVELDKRVAALGSGKQKAALIGFDAAFSGNFDLAGELLLKAYGAKDGMWLFPATVRLPEQAPDSEPWQEFWRQPGLPELAALRRSNGMSPDIPAFGSGAGR